MSPIIDQGRVLRWLLAPFDRLRRGGPDKAAPAPAPHRSGPDAVLAFWGNHGRTWAREGASPEDLAVIGALAEKTEALQQEAQQAEIVAALQQIWSEGFSDPADAFPWDGMKDNLSPTALAAFVQGAGEVWREKRQAS